MLPLSRFQRERVDGASGRSWDCDRSARRVRAAHCVRGGGVPPTSSNGFVFAFSASMILVVPSPRILNSQPRLRAGSFIHKGYLASFGNFRCDLDVLGTTVAPPQERHSHTVADFQSPRSNSGSHDHCFAFSSSLPNGFVFAFSASMIGSFQAPETRFPASPPSWILYS